MNPFPEARADLSGLEGYHSPQVDVPVRLNTNESPFPPPPGFVEAWTSALAAAPLHRYPDRDAAELRDAVATWLGQPAERVHCGNGSNEVLQALMLAYGGAGRLALVFEPTYALHSHIAGITGTAVATGERGPGFAVDPDAAAELCRRLRPDITFLCTPNNPTGVVEARDVVEAVLDAAPGLVVVDEAYGEFAPWSVLDLVDDERPLAVVRTFSKVWSLAAVRLGLCIAPPWLVDDLRRVTLPYHLSTPTQVAGTLAVRWADEMRRRVDSIVGERERVLAAVGGLVEAFPSGANFVLFRPPGDGHAVWQALLDRGVLVRDFSRWPRLDDCLRVTIGAPEENDAFLAALKEALS